MANDAAHLVWAVNLGVIDFNPWPARRDDLDHPDELRVDLDPTPGVEWDDGAPDGDGRQRGAAASTACAASPKTSGSKGIHVNVRHRARVGLPSEVRRAALALAREVERRAPDLATSKWWKEERHGVFVDYNQNARDRTVASCYSVRPTPDARVSCALAWDEVPDVEPGDLRIDTVPAAAADRRRPRGRHRRRTPGIARRAATTSHGATRRAGLGDAPWPPHFRKQRGEPKRVQPSRDRDRPRPTQRGRAGDPQPGGPAGPQQRRPHEPGKKRPARTGQGYDDEFEAS